MPYSNYNLRHGDVHYISELFVHVVSLGSLESELDVSRPPLVLDLDMKGGIFENQPLPSISSFSREVPLSDEPSESPISQMCRQSNLVRQQITAYLHSLQLSDSFSNSNCEV